MRRHLAASPLRTLRAAGRASGRFRDCHDPGSAPAEPGSVGKDGGMHCAIETGGFEHELHAILGEEAHA
jgi:hypothetical protein